MVAQDSMEVTLCRREDRWKPVILDSADAILELRSVGLEVSLAMIYEDEG